MLYNINLISSVTKWVNKDTGLSDWNDQSAKDADYFTDWGNDQWNQWADGYDTLVNYLMVICLFLLTQQYYLKYFGHLY